MLSPSGWASHSVRAATDDGIIDAVMTLVGGDMTARLIDVMTERMVERATYPRLAIAGASAGNMAEMLWTRIYLYQVQIYGASHGTRAEADELIAWIRDGSLKPVLHGTFRLSDIHRAEAYFAERENAFLGKIAVIPDAEWEEHGTRFAP